MYRIGSARLRYNDPELNFRLTRLQRMTAKKAAMLVTRVNLNIFTLPPVSLENLKNRNIIFQHDENGKEECYPMGIDFAMSDMILFSSKKGGSISTKAHACFSYTLLCRGMGLGAAVHVRSSHWTDPDFHLYMVLHDYANLKRIAPNAAISAFISGGWIPDDIAEEPEIVRAQRIDNNREIIASVACELTGRGVTIEVIDVGGQYKSQALNLETESFTVDPPFTGQPLSI